MATQTRSKGRPVVLAKTLKVISLRAFYAWWRLRPSLRRAPWVRVNASFPTRSPLRPCGTLWIPSPCAGPLSLARASATKRPCSTSAKKWARNFPTDAKCLRSTLPSIRSKARISALLAPPVQSPCLPRPERGGLLNAPDCYMEKIVVGPSCKNAVELDAPVVDNLKNIAKRLDRDVEDLVVIVLDRPRHEKLIADIRAAGARIRLIGDGDLSAGIAAAVIGTGVHAVMGSGGAPEGVITAAAIRCLNGYMLGRLVVKSDQDERLARMGIKDKNRIYEAEDLAPGKQLIFAATGVTDGALMKGVRFFGEGTRTSSVILTHQTGKVRFIESIHLEKGPDVKVRFA